MITIFFDECGFTGSNLCDREQPVLTLASIQCTEDECREIKSRFFGKVKAPELKYKQLARRPGYRKLILQFMQYLHSCRNKTRIAYAHKHFALLCKAIDQIVEPAFRKKGIDLYERGANLAMANMMYFVLKGLADQEYYDELLTAVQSFMTNPSDDTYEDLGGTLLSKVGVPGVEIPKPVIEQFQMTAGAASSSHSKTLAMDPFNTSLPTSSQMARTSKLNIPIE